MKIQPWTLGIGGNRGLTVFLTVRDEIQNITGTASLQLKINMPPQHGELVIEPETGEPFTTLFTATARYWSDDEYNLPLEYEVGYKKLDGSLERLTARDERSVKEKLLLPEGKDGDGVVDVVLLVYDSLGATANMTTSVVVTYSDEIN